MWENKMNNTVVQLEYEYCPKKISFEYKGKKYEVTDEDVIWDMLSQCINDDAEFYEEVQEVIS